MWYTFFKTLFKCCLFYKAALTQEPWSDSVSLLLPPVCSLLRYFCVHLFQWPSVFCSPLGPDVDSGCSVNTQ